MHAQAGFDFGAESAFARATVDTDISNKAAVAAATWFQRGKLVWQRRHLRLCPVSRLPVLCQISRLGWC